MLRSSILPSLAAALLLGGCNLAPTYVRPVGSVPADLPAGGVYPAARPDGAADISLVGWREFFTDTRLAGVIESGLANNRDLRIAAGNVLQARAQYRVQRADRVPTTTIGGAATYTNNIFGATGATAGCGGTTGTGGGTGGTTGGGIGGTTGGGTGGTTGGGTGGTTGAGAGATTGTAGSDIQFYTVTAGFSAFELDLFGRVRNLSRAAQERYLASEEGERATRISLIAEIATAWLTMASDQDQLALSRQTLQTFSETLRLTQAQFRIGVASELESRQAETNYQAARNDVAVAETRIAQDRNALNLLVGATVPAEQLPAALGATPVTLDSLPSDLSSAVLLKRPDILQAEHQLIAENANIGAARAAFFPKISLTATLGTIGTALGNLFSGGSYTYTGSPSVGLPLFDGGRIRGNLDYARASQQVAVATYERAIQSAFRETADALAQRGTIGEQLSAQTQRAEAASVAARLSDARYRAGVDSFLNTLDTQRTAYAARQQLVTTRLTSASNLVALYRALGGGLDQTSELPGESLGNATGRADARAPAKR